MNRLLFNHYPDAVYSITIDGRFHTVNDKVCQILQKERKELLGKGYQLHIHPEHWENALQHFTSAREGNPQRYQTVVRNSSGESVFIDVTNFPLKVGGQLVGIFGIAKDVTVQQEREQALWRTTQELQRQNDELDLFRKIVAHDFRSPIARILGLGSLLQKDNLPPATHQTAVSALMQSAQQLDAMVRDLNEMLSLRHQGQEARELCHIENLVKLTIASLQQEIKNANASVHIESEGPLEIFTVKAFLVSILHNLISNALKYRSPERPVEVTVSVSKQATKAIIAVSDNGTGMDMGKVGTDLFKMYKRFHAGVDGKGLGLYLVSEQVSILHGEVKVESTEGTGTTFTVILPLNNQH
ncbi:sensor histidine kinase [Pontibacter oryzae]|uniref:sensor histidine kinase n=1 Tax=Pontibacter oryzae TaxID=2304593 RepID=UPI00131583C7|nr:PAS domain-containing sensor histidine kinase [Pontibacter oryzae]